MKSSPNDPSSVFDLQAYRELYLTQARESLAHLRDHLHRLAQHPSDPAALREAHRAAHTLKGMSSTMHYQDLTALASAMETPLRQAESGGRALVPGELEALIELCNEFEAGLQQLPPGGSERQARA